MISTSQDETATRLSCISAVWGPVSLFFVEIFQNNFVCRISTSENGHFSNGRFPITLDLEKLRPDRTFMATVFELYTITHRYFDNKYADTSKNFTGMWKVSVYLKLSILL